MEVQILVGVMITVTSSALLGCFAFMIKIIVMVHNHDRQIPIHANDLSEHGSVLDVHEMRLDNNDVRYENHEVRITSLEGSK